MRIPTVTQYSNQINTMSLQFQNLNKLQIQDSSQVVIQNSSDDPILAEQIKSINDYISTLGTYTETSYLAQNRASLFDTSIENVTGSMAQVHKLYVAAQNETLNNGDRVNISKELQSYLQNIYNAANSNDGNGNSIYAGANTGTPAFSNQNGFYQYQGGRQPTLVEIAPNVTAIYNQSGYDIFENIPTGNGTFSISAAPSNTGTASTTAGTVSNASSYIPDIYTISFVTNSAGNLAYQVVGATSGQVVPAPPATSPADAPNYLANTDIGFNGVSFTMVGEPAIGDTFQVTPSTNQSVFNTIQNMINLLQKPINTSQDQAYFKQNMTQLCGSLEQASVHLEGCLSDSGSRSAAIDTQVNINLQVAVQQQQVLSKLADVDPFKVTSALNQQLSQLQITQQVYIKIQDTLTKIMQI